MAVETEKWQVIIGYRLLFAALGMMIIISKILMMIKMMMMIMPSIENMC